MQNEKFSKWANDIGLTKNSRLVGVMYTLLGKYKDADKLLDQGGSVEKVLGVLKSKGVPGVDQAEAILQGGGAEAPKSQAKDEGDEPKGRASRLSELRQNARKNQADDGSQDGVKQTPFDDKTAAEKGQPVQSDKPMSRLDKRRAERAGQGKGKGGLFGRGKTAGGKPSSMMLIVAIVAVLLVVTGGVFFMMNGGGGGGFGGPSSDFGDFGSGGGDPSIFGPDLGGQTVETAPQPPDSNPLNFRASINDKGFLGQAQKLVFILGLGIIGALVGDIVYRKQWWDGITALLGVAFTIIVLFPAGTATWIGVVFLFRELYLIWFASFQGGRDFTPMAAYFLLVGVFGGLIFTRIGAIQNIFPSMLVASVPPMAQLGYYFQVMEFASLAFPAFVYLTIIVGTILTIYECVRPSEDKSSRLGSLIAAGIGLVIYGVFVHGVGLAAWIAFLIAVMAASMGSAALRSEPAKQFVTPVWGVRSPFDGGMLLCAVLLLLVVIFGQTPWLIPLL